MQVPPRFHSLASPVLTACACMRAVCAELEAEEGRAVGPQDVGTLREALARLQGEQGLGEELVDEQLLESYASCPGAQLLTACACG